MKRKIVFILSGGYTVEAETSFEPFYLFANKELVKFPSGQKAYIYKDKENIDWRYTK